MLFAVGAEGTSTFAPSIIPIKGTTYSHVGTKSVPSRGLFASLNERRLGK